MSTSYSCGTCGSRTLIIGSTWDAVHGLYVWVLRCGAGHPLVPSPSNVLTVQFVNPVVEVRGPSFGAPDRLDMFKEIE